ncbi:DegV family protein [Lactobacillus acetotolerans]|jgi:DegV family protein with EDD domain|uniref:DegV family protein n=2 Tax=Lactobacillus acetotolerans TaxID=1600 RepID=A0A5P5ZHV0_9LACO|nr:DegV family protein [Lactobacillus acetotolerans]KRN41626.1 degv family protein [Lactobacillus acetotolerans DSM 20749 = JCM 3825]QFG51064.1 DegV family protein [Lactobacillus acetotolerans]QJD73734.1 DegV family protein [Lactobacillus acetotolerans]GGV11367.1 hypothetical protein GCM10011628_05980 [Lactobacillus acetotolerans DSM 20749 = JCM 3825]
MKKVKLILDSSANEQSDESENIQVVPLTLFVNGKEFLDDDKLNIDDFIKNMESSKQAGKTACPSIQEWLDALEGSDEVIIITVTSGMSGSFSSALQAKTMYEDKHPGSHIIVVDSRSAGPEMSIVLHEIERLLKTKIRFVDLDQKIAEYRMHTHLLVILQSLHNLALNGRVNPAIAKLAELLKIDVVGTASQEGKLEPLIKVHGMRRALREVLKRMGTMKYNGKEVIIDQCQNEKDAKILKEKIVAKYPKAKVTIRPSHGLCAFYAEVGSLMVGFAD